MADEPKHSTRLPWHPVIAVGLVVALYYVTQILGGLLISIYPALRHWTRAETSDWLQSSVSAQFFFVLIVEALTVGGLVVFLRYYHRRLADIGLRRRPRLSDGGWALLVYPIYFFTFAAMVIIVKQLVPAFDIDQKQELGFNNITGALPLILTFVSLVILPPLVEELLVRGFLFGSLRSRLKFLPAALITSLLFASAHLPEGGAAGPLYIAALDTFILSMYLCYLRAKTGSLWAGIFVHAIKNGVAYASLYIFVSH